jgi:hypothetical protein
MKTKKAKQKKTCTHKNAWPDFELWELVCADCGRRRDMEEEEGNAIFARMTGLDRMGDWH